MTKSKKIIYKICILRDSGNTDRYPAPEGATEEELIAHAKELTEASKRYRLDICAWIERKIGKKWQEYDYDEWVDIEGPYGDF